MGKRNKDTFHIANPQVLGFKVQDVDESGREEIGQNTRNLYN